jgi:hypothetical protein
MPHREKTASVRAFKGFQVSATKLIIGSFLFLATPARYNGP